MSNKKKSAFKKVLEDHQKDGKLYRAFPYENLKPLSYLETVMPELIMVHLTNVEYGPSASEEILSDIAESLDNAPWIGAVCQFAYKLSSNKQRYSARIQKCPSFKYFDQAIAPFAAFYPNFPLAEIVASQSQSKDWLAKFKIGLHDLYDKRGDAGAAMLGVFTLVGINQNGLLGSETLNPESIRKYIAPGTRRDGDMVRAALGAATSSLFACFREETKMDFWSQSFWQRGLEIEPIDWSILTSED